ncbi:MAG: RNA-binding transcriptional accessory protein [Deltaproteobacteria bacterium]|nr:RNA-binding transcriptional accessory protein [Deltaproteobacteria bacterium]
MEKRHIVKIADELKVKESQVEAVALLLEQDATIPFIARYRKEATGSLDEVIITSIRDMLHRLQELEARRESILKSLEEHGHLTDELKEQVLAAETMAILEDIYLPYRPKRRTRATIAREKGLEPLAELIFAQNNVDPFQEAAQFIDPEKGVENAEDALSGARDIMAEKISEDQDARGLMRRLFESKGIIKSRLVNDMESKGQKYKDYFNWEEPLANVPSHRILAMRRGEKEGILYLSIEPHEEDAVKILEGLFVTGVGEDSNQVKLSIQDSYKRLLSRSMETEARLKSKEKADKEAIKVFADNLRELLLTSPLGGKNVMGIDPGFRTGCKLVCLDRQGKFLVHDTIFPNMNEKRDKEAGEIIKRLCTEYQIDAIAVGNGTASRETEAFLRGLDLSENVQIVMVNESGASVYSASEVARDEFPDLDLTVRGAISIGRRLMDPLAELVKIEPKSIGVGQYQHDVDQVDLKNTLDDVVMSCVNKVGVDLNRASAQLLTYISGLGLNLAKNIVAYRNENGPFESRDELKTVPRLGPKAFEQSAGFLRIINGKNPLDASAVHPESYHVVDKMAEDLGCSVADLLTEPQLREKIKLPDYVGGEIGIPTLKDIMEELAKPGRDPRDKFEPFGFEKGVEKIGDIKIGMRLPGIITNVTAFGAFVDIGVHQDGLVHISELSDTFVKNPSDLVKVGQKVNVSVIGVDIERNRISLSMKTVTDNNRQQKKGKSKKPPVKKAGRVQKERKTFGNPLADLFKQKQ